MEFSQVHTVLQTKLHRPLLASSLVPRQRLLPLLDQISTCTLTLVVAPAGSGKTSLVCQWLEDRDLPAAWLQLDSSDSNPSVFFTYIVHAMRHLASDFGVETESLLKSPLFPPLKVVVNTLSNEIEHLGLGKPALLILDDYHLVQNPEIDQALADLVSLPPRGWHLVIISRQRPPWSLGKLRMDNRLLEVGALDLRFTQGETADYLRLNGISTESSALSARLHRQTEGWVTGLQLAALAMRYSRADPELIEKYSGFAGDDTRYLLEYMADEVLADLSAPVLRFMLATSICSRFNVALCEKLTGQDRTSVTSALRFLEEANLFLVRLDDGVKGLGRDHSSWYRYHHLMEQTLVNRLYEDTGRDVIAELHQRAASWLGGQGYVEEAIEHLAAISDWETAARLMMSNLDKVLDQDDRHIVDRWLSIFPREEVGRRPELLLIQAWTNFFNLEIPSLAHVLQRISELTQGLSTANSHNAPESFPGNLSHEFVGQYMLLEGAVAFFGGSMDATIAFVQKALVLLPRDEGFLYNNARYFLANAMQAVGRGEEAEEMLLQAYQRAQAKPSQTSARLLFALASVRIFSGKLAAARDTAEQLLRESRTAHLALLEGWAHDTLGRIEYERNHLDSAQSHFKMLTEHCHAVHRGCAYDGFTGSMLVAAAQGRADVIAQVVDAWRSFDEFQWGLPSPLFYSVQARTALLTGDINAARSWADTFSTPLSPASMPWMEVSHVTKIRCLLASDSPKDLAAAIELTDTCLEHAERGHNVLVQVTLIGLRALLMERLGKRKTAIELLTHGLRLTVREGFVRTYVDLGPQILDVLRAVHDSELSDYVATLIAAIPISATTPRTLPELLDSPVATLTRRELEVLALLASPMTLQEIAHELSISYSTVRQHTAHIYEKLGVNKRRHAVVTATELGLL